MAFFDHIDVFAKFIQQHTKDHSFLIIDQTSAKYKLEDIFFTDKISDLKEVELKFRIGTKSFWKDAGESNSYVKQVTDFL
jgi:hypothetical protein